MRHALIVAALASSAAAGCVTGLRGSGTLKEETREVGTFTAVEVGPSIQATVVIGPAAPLKLSGDDNILPLIVTEVKDGRLVTSFKQSGGFRSVNPVKMTITAPLIESVSAAAGSSVTGPLNGKKLKVEASAGSTIDATEIAADEVTVDSTAGSTVTLAGKTKALTLSMAAGSSIHARKLDADSVTVDGSAGSTGDVSSGGSVSGSISAGSTLKVAGSPKNRSVSTSAGSSVNYETKPTGK